MTFSNFNDINKSTHDQPTDHPGLAQSKNHKRPTHFSHITLTTGHTNRQSAPAADNLATSVLKPLVSQSLQQKHPVPVPVLGSDIFIRVSREDGAFCLEILVLAGGLHLPAVTVGISLDGFTGRSLWRRLLKESTLPCIAHVDSPNGPWIGARIEHMLFTLPPLTISMLGDFECCIAWALVELVCASAMATSKGASEVKPSETSNRSPADLWPLDASKLSKHGKMSNLNAACESDCVAFDFSRHSGPTLFISYNTPDASEVTNFRRGKARFALAQRAGLVFLLAKFGNEEWMDAPFHAGLYAPEIRGVPDEWRDGMRLALSVVIIDSATGQQRGARDISFDPSFSSSLIMVAKQQAAAPIDRATYDQVINTTYRAFPTSRSMLAIARTKCIGGT